MNRGITVPLSRINNAFPRPRGTGQFPSEKRSQCQALFIQHESVRRGGGVWGGPTKSRLLKLDFPSAKLFWVKIFLGLGGSQSRKDPPPSCKTKPDQCICPDEPTGTLTELLSPQKLTSTNKSMELDSGHST